MTTAPQNRKAPCLPTKIEAAQNSLSQRLMSK